MENIIFITIGYFLGSIPFGLILTRLAGLGDVRQIGSGSIGGNFVDASGGTITIGGSAVVAATGGAGTGSGGDGWGIGGGGGFDGAPNGNPATVGVTGGPNITTNYGTPIVWFSTHGNY